MPCTATITFLTASLGWDTAGFDAPISMSFPLTGSPGSESGTVTTLSIGSPMLIVVCSLRTELAFGTVDGQRGRIPGARRACGLATPRYGPIRNWFSQIDLTLVE